MGKLVAAALPMKAGSAASAAKKAVPKMAVTRTSAVSTPAPLAKSTNGASSSGAASDGTTGKKQVVESKRICHEEAFLY